jgi:hypothetical protein
VKTKPSEQDQISSRNNLKVIKPALLFSQEEEKAVSVKSKKSNVVPAKAPSRMNGDLPSEISLAKARTN